MDQQPQLTDDQKQLLSQLTDDQKKALYNAIAAAKQEESIDFNIVEYLDFTKMEDAMIAHWLLATEPKEYAGQEVDEKKAPGNLFADENIWEIFKEADDYQKRQAAFDALVGKIEEKHGLYDYGDIWESKKHKKHKKHKKYSSFKNQQTITENFRRFLKK